MNYQGSILAGGIGVGGGIVLTVMDFRLHSGVWTRIDVACALICAVWVWANWTRQP